VVGHSHCIENSAQAYLVNFAERSEDMADPLRPEPPLGVSRAGGFAHNQGMIQAIKQKLT
jgi:hypothetical protein